MTERANESENQNLFKAIYIVVVLLVITIIWVTVALSLWKCVPDENDTECILTTDFKIFICMGCMIDLLYFIVLMMINPKITIVTICFIVLYFVKIFLVACLVLKKDMDAELRRKLILLLVASPLVIVIIFFIRVVMLGIMAYDICSKRNLKSILRIDNNVNLQKTPNVQKN
jgi:hypothetical protein